MDYQLFKTQSVAKAHLCCAMQRLPVNQLDKVGQRQAQAIRSVLEQSQVFSIHRVSVREQLEEILVWLTDVGQSVHCSGGFWRELERAAILLVLPGHIHLCRAQFNSALNRIKEGG